ncbi:MAG: PAS domain S-box protein [Chitinophagaceae bacterium]|nr:PAS domain S-box protein [Chitinophagaceae bacterium]
MDQSVVNAEQKFEAIFRNASVGILAINKAGEITMANAYLLRLFGYSAPEDLIGKNMNVLIPARYRVSHLHNIEAYGKNPVTRPMGIGQDLFGVTKTGVEIPLEISLSSFTDESGTYSIAFISDISVRVAVQAKLREQRLKLAAMNKQMEQLNEELEEKVKVRTQELEKTLAKLEQSKDELSIALNKEKDLGEMKSAFVSMASHEFRTPLSTILSSASLLAKYKLTDEQEKRDRHIQRIKSSVINLNNILNEFLSLGKMEEGKIKASFSEFDIEKLVSDQYTEMTDIFKPGQVIDYVHVGEKIVKLDPNFMKNIVINLLSNAAKFSEDNTTITVRTAVTDEKITFIVRDEGMGISEKDQQQLFSIFFRGSNAKNISGTGLGLHIVGKYTEMMKGNLNLKSELNKGTEITITFPR